MFVPGFFFFFVFVFGCMVNYRSLAIPCVGLCDVDGGFSDRTSRLLAHFWMSTIRAQRRAALKRKQDEAEARRQRKLRHVREQAKVGGVIRFLCVCG